MKTQVAVYLESQRGPQPRVVAQAALDAALRCTAPSAERALAQLQTLLVQHLQTLSGQVQAEALAQWLNPPVLDAPRRIALRLRVGGQYHAGDTVILSYQALDRTLAFTPRWPQRHFEWSPEDALPERVAEVYAAWIKEGARNEGMPTLDTLLLPATVSTRLCLLELEWNPVRRRGQPPRQDLAGLGGRSDEVDGAAELTKVGRLLNALYPDGLERALGREPELAELQQALAHPERRAVLLLGPAGVGKTCLIHEWIATRRAAQATIPRLWLLSPQRLISGMVYLGQWEARLLAILEHAARSGAVLYFDDLLGLFSAGQSSGSALSVGDVLLPWIVRRRVRVLGEITPEAWRVLRERRREFADQFALIPVAEPAAAATWRILASLMRELEQQYQLRFALDAIPTALALSERHQPELAFPGRVAGFLRTLAARAQRGLTVSRSEVLAEYARRTGLRPALLDHEAPLLRSDIEQALRRRLQGQPQAVQALADALLRAKAGLNDPGRPLATLLLLGPTGVGKTACAKALAEYLGGAAATLIRIDLNEYTEYGDAARLVGTFGAPDGVLTSAIRRTPHAVVLLDEIEKAAPDVFDLLLSLLDEGRLTDAHGRVAWFRQAFVLMTSNLGAREAQSRLGFTAGIHAGASYLEAARRHFRPEFFNRIDHILPFAPLADAELMRIAEVSVQQALNRAGVRARQCLIDIDEAARAQLLLAGRDPLLGARALKRAVERQLVQPLARALASSRFDQPTHLRLSAAHGALTLEARTLQAVAAEPAIELPQRGEDGYADWLQAIDGVLAEIDERLAAHAGAGVVALGTLADAQAHYYACREQRQRVGELCERAQRPLPRRAPRQVQGAHSGLKVRTPLREGARPLGSDQKDWALWTSSSAQYVEQSPLAAILRELSWLVALVEHPARAAHTLQLAPLTETAAATAAAIAAQYAAALALLPGCLEARLARSGRDWLLHLDGFALTALLAPQRGWWLLHEERLGLIGVSLDGVAPDAVVHWSDGRHWRQLRHGLEVAQDAEATIVLRWLQAGLAWPEALR